MVKDNDGDKVVIPTKDALQFVLNTHNDSLIGHIDKTRGVLLPGAPEPRTYLTKVIKHYTNYNYSYYKCFHVISFHKS